MKFLLPIALIVAVILVYALWGRDWLKAKPWAAPFFEWVEPIEVRLFKKSETVLVARTLSILGPVLTLLTQLGTVDITPLMPFVPDEHQGLVQFVWNLLPLTITGLGMIVEKLRNNTTVPIEIAALPDKALAEKPAVAEVVAKLQDVKAEAVAVVKEEAV